jgi:hypothetical protein
MYQGKNVFGGDVHRKYYGGPISGVIAGANVEGEAEGAYTINIFLQIKSAHIYSLSLTSFL